MLNTARIAKNTIFLYLRMVLVLAANFLAVRVLLKVLYFELGRTSSSSSSSIIFTLCFWIIVAIVAPIVPQLGF